MPLAELLELLVPLELLALLVLEVLVPLDELVLVELAPLEPAPPELALPEDVPPVPDGSVPLTDPPAPTSVAGGCSVSSEQASASALAKPKAATVGRMGFMAT